MLPVGLVLMIGGCTDYDPPILDVARIVRLRDGFIAHSLAAIT
jgi:hypothetical protein